MTDTTDTGCGASQPDNFEKVVLDDTTSNPMELAVADDGRVFYVDRNGDVRLIRPDGSATTVGSLDVYTGQEFGLMGIALDPDFASNSWMYLTYSPAGGDAVDRVSRFTLDGESLDLDSEEVVLEYETNREECCHAGGALEFDGNGDLYVATGDNTNPFASSGYTPIDERDGRELWDAQRTAANSNSLSGKVLRIHPEDDGSYTIPDGNMFAESEDTGDQTRPEIFAMGFRNPFRIGVDPATDTLLVADYGPDAGSSDPERGPDGRVEWNIVDETGFYGWPYCVGDNTPYVDYDFESGESGEPFDCAGGPVNDSPNNTGITQLPPAIEAEVWYGYSANPEFPEIGGGGAPMAGGVYRYDAELESDRQWPEYWDGKAIFGEWNQNNLYTFQLDESVSEVVDINQIFDEWDFLRPMAMQWGPDGALYLIEWGSGFGGDNPDSGVYRIDYVRGNRDPVARIDADPLSGPVPLEVTFDGSASSDPEGTELTFEWDFDGDGTVDSTEPEATHTYTEPGDYTVALTVTDADGQQDIANVEVVAGNTAPEIAVTAPVDGGFFEFGDTIAYEVSATDAEDGELDCEQIVTQPGLGHDDHSHGYEQYTGCTGEFPLPGDEGHTGANIFGTVTVTVTDSGANGASPLTSQEVLVLQPKRRQAEHFDDTGRLAGSDSGGDPGVQVQDTGDTAGGGQNIGWIEPDDWWAWEPMNLTDMDGITLRAASPNDGATVEVRTGAPDGPAVSTIEVDATGDWQVYDEFTGEISGETATQSGPLYFVLIDGQLNVNWVDFGGKGVTENQRPDVEVTADPTSGTAPLDVEFSAEASDPEGDEPLTYAWQFGDGGSATGATASHTYTEAGDYTAQVTVTDSRGAQASETVTIEVDDGDGGDGEPALCLDGRSDGFDGDELDRDRWTTVIRENQDVQVDDGDLVLPASATDIYGTNNTDTPNIVLQDLPDGPFTATAKLTMEAYEAYQQAGLMIYGDDDNYAKMMLQGRDTSGVNPDARIFQFIREENGDPNEVGDSNTGELGADYPDTVWVRYISDGSDLRAAYSADGVTFTEMPQTKSLAGMEDPKIGLVALSGTGNPVTEARFDYFHITPDDTVPAAEPDDEFDGAMLDGCRWNVLRPDASGYRVADGQLEVDTSDGDIYETGDSDPANFFLQPAPHASGDGPDDWTVETKVDGSALDEQYQQGGLIVYADDDNYVKFDYVVDNAAGDPVSPRIELRSEVDDAIQNPQPNAGDLEQGVWYLRIAKSGDTYTGSYSADGETWTDMGEPVTNGALAESDIQVGLFALGGPQNESKTAMFDYFHVVEEETDTTPPSLELAADPAEPPGANGWWTAPVEVSATATDDGDGEVLIEYRMDGGDWEVYTAPVVMEEDGEHVVEAHASDGAGNVSEDEELSFGIDATAPDVVVDGVEDGGSYELGASLDVEAVAEDATSGVASVTVELDGEPVENPANLTPEVGEHSVAATVVDEAGNEAEVSVPFEVTVTFAGVFEALERFYDEGALDRAQYRQLDTHLSTGQRHVERELARPAGLAFDRFVRVAGDVADEQARAYLLEAAEHLRRHDR
ncbi:PQQ-dependent sugar dehydrogenase [Phytoactinopolyspora halophila]|uniref:PKD domain-containing protein n=1 Tax=Phytoactinopolyspora halophila TaxID=1981511 RepID=A0A329QZJ5_9ACTN|nr:PQQ-dependent sugar dehydrogenase [Phytoactinopolyspora halophila]RAW17647.1 PKD domain-containing protein [Phytoactinopolyspora halophila]